MGASLEWTARTRRNEGFPVRGAACVVEPDPELRERLTDMLRGMGYTTHETASGAVGAFIAEQIHLQLAVVNMSVADAKGLKLVRLFRRQCPGAAIVAISPSGLGAVLGSFAGADAVLAAPATSEALSGAIAEAIGATHYHVPEVADDMQFSSMNQV